MAPPLIDLTPLLNGIHARQMRVAGVVLGDSAFGIDTSLLTDASGFYPGERRIYSSPTIYQIIPAGSQKEIPLQERIEGTLLGGGILQQGDASFTVADGVITKITVRGLSLTALNLTREEHIEHTFGSAEGHNREYGSHFFYYPSRGLMLSWGSRGGRLESVVLGINDWREPRLGAPALLTELLDFHATQSFNRKLYAMILSMNATEPRSVGIRRMRVAALCRALGLGSPANVINGKFLPKVLDAGRQCVLNDMAEHAQIAGGNRWTDARSTFMHLLRYRRDAEKLIRATSCWIECSEPSLVGMITAQNRIGRQLTTMLVDIDRWLCGLLDPDGRTFPIREMIEVYGWPDVDLREIELDEL